MAQLPLPYNRGICVQCGGTTRVYKNQSRTLCQPCYRKTEEFRALDRARRQAKARGENTGRSMFADPKARAQHMHLMRKYGLSLLQKEAMIVMQGGCAICGREQPGMADRWAVDHDHLTGRVRGILCYDCNTAIGKLGDDPNTLEKAAAYLRKAGR